MALLFQEIIQNAEDAGASCVKFIYNKNDYRQSSGKKYSADGLQQYQVSALVLAFFYMLFMIGLFHFNETPSTIFLLVHQLIDSVLSNWLSRFCKILDEVRTSQWQG